MCVYIYIISTSFSKNLFFLLKVYINQWLLVSYLTQLHTWYTNISCFHFSLSSFSLSKCLLYMNCPSFSATNISSKGKIHIFVQSSEQAPIYYKKKNEIHLILLYLLQAIPCKELCYVHITEVERRRQRWQGKKNKMDKKEPKQYWRN